MKGMILAAGLGTRFRPVTYWLPKPLIPLCGRRLIEYPLEALHAAGIRDVTVNVHHLPDELRRVLEQDSRFSISISLEKEILGTGGGVRRVRPELESEESFFLLNADTVQFPPLARLERARKESGALVALLVRHPPAGDRFTPVFFEDGQVTGFGEGSGESLMFSGCHSIGRDLLGRIPDREVSGIVEDVYMALTGEEGAIAAVVDDGPWFDIGSPRRYLTALGDLTALFISGDLPLAASMVREGTSLLGVDARCDGEISTSSIEGSSAIESGAKVEGSSVWPGAIVTTGCRVTRSIVTSEVTLPAGTVVENMLVDRRDRVAAEVPDAIIDGDLIAVAIDDGKMSVFAR